MRHLAPAALALALAGPTAAQDVPEGMAARYDCADGVTVAAAYINAPGGASYAVVAHDGGLVPMKAGPTGSGVRYVSLPGTEPPLVWHTKGADAFLAIDDAGETMIAGDCRTADLP
jgi:membrane-bound inhibitor of C-type lysozyme